MKKILTPMAILAFALLSACGVEVNSLEGTHWQCPVQNVEDRYGRTVSGTYTIWFEQNYICDFMLNGEEDGRAEYDYTWPNATLRVYSSSRSAIFPTDETVKLHLDDRDTLTTTVAGVKYKFVRAE